LVPEPATKAAGHTLRASFVAAQSKGRNICWVSKDVIVALLVCYVGVPSQCATFQLHPGLSPSVADEVPDEGEVS
jgi:hypothetical protein